MVSIHCVNKKGSRIVKYRENSVSDLFRVGILLSLIFPFSMRAAVQFDNTRVIFPAKEREVSIRLINKGNEPGLMQAWVDKGNLDIQPDNADAPFLVMPPIFRLDPKEAKSVRIIFAGEKLPQDRESLYWLNFLEVPAIPKENGVDFIQFALRSRFKLFYRPIGLPGNPSEAIKQVRWSIIEKDAGRYALKGENPTPYHITYRWLKLSYSGKDYDIDAGMINPFTQREYTLGEIAVEGGDGKLRYRGVSDYGISSEQQVVVQKVSMNRASP
ncbi:MULTISPECIES: molecular chaperone [unclassified Serratia (in: enterobacteria)]|uniref:fimbrial biogenesis chaperone n=1 Tax=unclassified Serratia (in: enterobacteria) TaxID=2647522 RepID=UPI00068B7C5D|nr:MULTISPECIES: molecular chaperone [unclassified Serratia (in: enterobacteria)]